MFITSKHLGYQGIIIPSPSQSMFALKGLELFYHTSCMGAQRCKVHMSMYVRVLIEALKLVFPGVYYRVVVIVAIFKHFKHYY